VLRPGCTQEISDILKYCNDNKIAVVPQGGNTGLVGGSVPVFDEVVISMTRLNKVKHFDTNYSVVHTQAGVILEKLSEHLKEYGYQPPVDLASKGSCQIGGNLATNAGGIRFIRFNSFHANCIGIEAVLPDGTILNDMKGLRKDNTGYDLKQLLIGSEGTLGIITEAALLCHKIAVDSKIAFIAVDTFEDVTKVLRLSKDVLGENLTAFELFDNEWNKAQLQYVGNENPLGSDHSFYILVESSTPNLEEPVEEKLLDLLDKCGDGIKDGVISQTSEQIQNIWSLRESKLN